MLSEDVDTKLDQVLLGLWAKCFLAKGLLHHSLGQRPRYWFAWEHFLANGHIALEQRRLDNLVESFSQAALLRKNTVANSIKGKVIEVDSGGALITDIASSKLNSTPRDISVRVTVDEHETFGLFSKIHDQPSMTLVAIVSEDEGPLRIELVDDSASAMLGVRAGAPVEVLW